MGKLYTLAVGQGNFAILVGDREVIVIDTHLPADDEEDSLFVKGVLGKVSEGKNMIGVILTGFDADHAEPEGLGMVLNNFNPSWIMYPKYWKDTETFGNVQKIIFQIAVKRKKVFKRVPVAMNKLSAPFMYATLGKLSNEFTLIPFSPFLSDETSSNNSSLVLKVIEKSTKRSILITGDTEIDRWNEIAKCQGSRLKADILQAPHHGSKHGITREAFDLIAPELVLISAGEDNQYGHPDREALEIFSGSFCYYTSTGQSFVTKFTENDIETFGVPFD